MRRLQGFMLFEVLLAVVIIMIMALIAVTNYQLQQHRTRLAGVRSDLRHISLACEAYATDNDYKMYPYGVLSFVTPNRESANWGYLPESLTTPVAYLKTLPIDPFGIPVYSIGSNGSASLSAVGSMDIRYRLTTRQLWPGRTGSFTPSSSQWQAQWHGLCKPFGISDECPYILASLGPDKREDMIPPYTSVLYDPSNGSFSFGDIAVTGGSR